MSRLKGQLVLGEDTKEECSSKHGTILTVGNCIWCANKVWVTEHGKYVNEGLDSQIASDIKPLHKYCLLETIQVGLQVKNAMMKDILQKEVS